MGSTRLSKLFIFKFSLTNSLNYWNICVHLLGYATNSIVLLIQFWFADFRYRISTGWDHQSCAVPTTSSWGQTCCTTHAYQVIVLTLQWYSLNLKKMVEELRIALLLSMSLEITDGFFCIKKGPSRNVIYWRVILPFNISSKIPCSNSCHGHVHLQIIVLFSLYTFPFSKILRSYTSRLQGVIVLYTTILVSNT